MASSTCGDGDTEHNSNAANITGSNSRLHHTASAPAIVAASNGDTVIPVRRSSALQPFGLKCCCGRKECAVLQYNNAALEGLERDLDTAAKLGQVSRTVFLGATNNNMLMNGRPSLIVMNHTWPMRKRTVDG